MTEVQETAQQVIGAFLVHLGQAPWEAEELLKWLELAGYTVSAARPSPNEPEGGVRKALERIIELEHRRLTGGAANEPTLREIIDALDAGREALSRSPEPQTQKGSRPAEAEREPS